MVYAGWKLWRLKAYDVSDKFFQKFSENGKKTVDKIWLLVYNNSCVAKRTNLLRKSGCGSVWLERLVWDQEVAGSNPVTPIGEEIFQGIFCGCSSVVEHQPSKLDMWVRFPSPAFESVAQLDRATAF